MGLPIGSGIGKSSCKWLIQQRFKGVRMRGGEDGFNYLLHLRLAGVNHRFDELSFPTSSPPTELYARSFRGIFLFEKSFRGIFFSKDLIG